MNNRYKYVVAGTAAVAFMAAAYYYPAETFLTFSIGWLFMIPAAFIVYMTYGFIKYMSDRKHRIMITVEPTDAMKAIARREAALKREKEFLYEELRREMKNK